MDVELVGCLLAGGVIGIGSWVLWGASGTTRERLRALAPAGAVEPRQLLLARSAAERLGQPTLALFARLGARLTPSRHRESLVAMLKQAGLSQPQALQLLLAAKILMPAIALLAGLVGFPAAASLVLAIVGFIGPDAWIKSRIRRRQEAIVTSLPDILDHLTSCIESGLSLDGAIQRIAAHPGAYGQELKQELTCYLGDMRLGQSRSEALSDLARRCGGEDIQGLVAALLQAEQLGVSIGPVLRSHGQHLRTRRRQRAQEAAMKAPVKMLFPLVFCIFPAMFVVILGPAMLRMIDTFSQINR